MLMPTSLGRQPDRDDAEDEDDEALAAHRAAGDKVLQAVLAAAQNVFEVGRIAVALRAARTPGASAARSATLAPGTAAALVTPRHRTPFLTLQRPAESRWEFKDGFGFCLVRLSSLRIGD